MKQKVFGIGLSKTGTSSLIKALQVLGYKAIHYPRNLDLIENYDAAADISVASSYKELDSKYPEAKFILTIRDKESWLQSLRIHSQMHPPHTRSTSGLYWRKKMWGATQLTDKEREAVYDRHLQEVKAYFKNKKDKLLIMDICGGDGWEILCPFLGIPIPKKKFPEVNVTKNKKKFKQFSEKIY